MTRTMYDGVNPATVPAGAAVYAGYNQGSWQSLPALVAKFPAALHVSICVNASGSARVLDVETGDATPEQAPGWVTRQRAGGAAYPVVYCNTSTWPAVRAAFAAQRVAPPLYWVAEYVADPTRPPVIPAGAIGIQYYDHGGYDASLVADYWPGLDPAPVPIAQLEENDVANYTQTCNPATGRAGIGHAAGEVRLVQVTFDKGDVSAGVAPAFDVCIVLDTGPVVIADNAAAPEGKLVVHYPAGHQAAASGVIAKCSVKGLEYELYAERV